MKYTVSTVTTYEVREDSWTKIGKPFDSEDDAYRMANTLNLQFEKAIKDASKEVQKTLESNATRINQLEAELAAAKEDSVMLHHAAELAAQSDLIPAGLTHDDKEEIKAYIREKYSTV